MSTMSMLRAAVAAVALFVPLPCGTVAAAGRILPERGFNLVKARRRQAMRLPIGGQDGEVASLDGHHGPEGALVERRKGYRPSSFLACSVPSLVASSEPS